MQLSEKDKFRFWNKVMVGTSTECWPWLGSTDKGYGEFWIGGRLYRTHRVAYHLSNGRLPAKGKMVMHDCENSLCVNPSHLLEGTNKQNLNYPGFRRKQSEIAQARKPSAATKARISASLKGRVIPADVRGRMSASRKGKPRSAETRARISESLKGRHATHRQRADTESL